MENEKKTERRKNIIAFGKNLLVNNFAIKLLAIAGAILVWILIVNIDDPYKSKTFMVHVQTINEDALRSVNKVYEVVEGSTASIIVRGKRSIIDEMKSTDIEATADLSDLSSVNAVAIKAILKGNYSSDVELECNQVLKVSLENMEKKQVKVSVETEGIPSDGFSVGECVAKPNVIEVTGGESVVDRITTVKVKVNVNGASESFVQFSEPVAYDKKGNRIDSSTLSFGVSKVKVHTKLLQNKTIPVKVLIKGRAAKGYCYQSVKCIPEKIEIAGSQKQLSGINKLVIPIDITGMTSKSYDLEQEIYVEDYLPENIVVAEEYQRISVKIIIEKFIKKKIRIPVDSIKLEGLKTGYSADVYSDSGMFELTVEGTSSDLKKISDSSCVCVADCAGLKEGDHKLSIKVTIDGKCIIVKKSKVRIEISKEKNKVVSPSSNPEVSPKETPEPTQLPESTDSPTE